MQAPPPPGLAQARAACPVPFLTQGHPQPTGTIAAFVKAKDLDQGGFPGRCFLCHRPLLALVPGVKAAGRHAQRLAEPPHGVVAALGGDEAAAAHWSGVCEITRLKRLLAMAFFKIFSSGAGRRARARSWRSSAAVAGSSAASNGAATGVWTAFGRRLGGVWAAFGRLFAPGRGASGRCSAPEPRLGSSGLARPGARLQRGRPHHICGVCQVLAGLS